MVAKKPTDDVIEITPIESRQIVVGIIGTSPIILNRMASKAQHELLLPRGRKTAADKAAELKHDPIAEFQASPYRLPDGSPTLLAVMASSIKGAMMTAALDLPGAKKAQIGRLVYVQDHYLPLYGKPELFMSITRSADMNRTPDVRTRAIVDSWAMLVKIRYVTPILTQTSVLNLLQAAGTTAGIGDWRPEKGKGSFGQFRIAKPDDEELSAIVQAGGRDVQIAAMDTPHPYDLESEDLLSWFEEEVQARGRAPVRMARTG